MNIRSRRSNIRVYYAICIWYDMICRIVNATGQPHLHLLLIIYSCSHHFIPCIVINVAARRCRIIAIATAMSTIDFGLHYCLCIMKNKPLLPRLIANIRFIATYFIIWLRAVRRTRNNNQRIFQMTNEMQFMRATEQFNNFNWAAVFFVIVTFPNAHCTLIK